MEKDDELIQIFIDEAHDLTVEINDYLGRWQAAPLRLELLAPILRALHTLKGSARMLDFTELSEYVHGLEQIVQVVHTEQLTPSTDIIKKISSFFEVLNEYLEIFANVHALPDKKLPLEKLKSLLSELKGEQRAVGSKIDLTEEIIEEIAEETEKTDTIPKRVSRPAAGIRVKTESLDNFNKLAEQVNIARAQLEEQAIKGRKIVAETAKEITLLHELLRFLQSESDHPSIQTEYDKNVSGEEFDVIELERYSLSQQTAADCEDRLKQLGILNTLMSGTIRSIETLLTDQGRAARALETEIIHVRMVSTDQLVERLERIVNQVSKELGKEAHFKCVRSQGEVDRKILENLTSPLEHMIRNAIDHGIEFPDERRKKNKRPYGLITLSLHDYGNEMVIQLTDDGQGVDVEKVEARAIAKKIWDPSIKMTLADAIQIIALPSFSIKEEITPISGRGLGLDVAIAAVNKLGGTLLIDSQKGVGTQFTIRLPFTLSLNRALIFTMAKQYYAILLTHLIGLTRKSLTGIKYKLKHAQGKITHLNEKYELIFLKEMLGEGTREDYKKNVILPILLLGTAEKKIALVVDSLMGSQEIIVNPTGTQLKFVREIAGVSLLGDNQIVLILNAPYIIQRAESHPHAIPTAVKSSPRTVQKLKVLVVDDSSTVRRVTSRLLQRHHYEVLTAKDGMDALVVMASHLPDVVLLDIEMPRMDGFETLDKMRTDPRYKNIPVIIITTRSGEKYQAIAEKKGANYYLSKPYREEELLALLKEMQANLNQD